MKKQMKVMNTALASMLLLIGLSACSSTDKPATSTTPAATATSKATEAPKAVAKPLVVGIEAEPKSLSPYNATDGNSSGVQGSMFEGLLKLSADMKVVPQLATEYKLSADAKSITFTLRPNVTFHDGSKLTAQGVKDSLDFVRNKANKQARASFFEFVESITVVDETHVTITSKAPNSAMAAYMAHSAASILSPAELKKKKDDPNYNMDRNPVGTGPFKFAEWKDGQYVKVVPYDGYWDAEHKAKLESVTYKPVKEASTRVNMLKTGELDVVKNVPSQSAKELSTDTTIDISKNPSMDVFYVGANNKLPQYNKEVRQAMNYAVNKEQLIAQVENGYGRIADSAIAPNVIGYSPQKPYEFNLEKAKELMKKGGYEKGFEATLWTRNDTEFVAIAENVSIQLGKIGINAKVVPMESGTLFDKLDSGKDIDMYIGRWSPGTGEADWGLRPNFHSTRIPPSYNNDTFYINKEVDDLLDGALSSSDSKKTQENYDKIQKIVYEDAAWLYLLEPESIIGKRKDVSNVVLLPTGYIDVNNAVKK
ncbi:glutathione ABC transporter substrate-binding protein [Paenibacillus roseipurpureus]|uniref:Glutathione ABC transporter substrate-binding protein n=1 Tax=Paenibacillus roseopurpureus TaxID=2918901 RepID=A0AA96LPY6_9BACL|nr:glutathione ABC transporter substrate-binding protein [Paenibacillus sp. MBLB1832]WNR46112.1 glutathione ABC transporter substrate-binding protein [Paenibacillus sp. MBLB1832]